MGNRVKHLKQINHCKVVVWFRFDVKLGHRQKETYYKQEKKFHERGTNFLLVLSTIRYLDQWRMLVKKIFNLTLKLS